jgi:hypothetical protein
MYGCEAWALKESTKQKLSVFEGKIFGPTKEDNGIWRIKTNKELDELLKQRNILNSFKAQKLRWFGHIRRMSKKKNIVKKIYTWKPFTGRQVGRPKSR